jgi:hypothetical protein
VEESERLRNVSDERLLRARDRPPPEKASFQHEEEQEQEQEAPPLLSRGNKHLQTIWGKKKNWKLKCRETRNSSSQYGVNRNRSTLPFSFFSCTRVTLLALLSLLTLLHNTCKPKPKRSGVSFLFFLYFTYFNHTTTLVNRNRSALPLLSSPPLFYLLEPHKTGKPNQSALPFLYFLFLFLLT